MPAWRAPPSAPSRAARRHPDQRAEHRHQRQRDRHREPGDGVGDGDPRQDRERDGDGEDQLRQVAGEIAVERVEAGGGQLGELAGAPRALPAGAERQHASQQAAAELGLGGGARAVRAGFRRPGRQRPDGDHGRERRQQRRAHRGPGGERPGDRGRQQLGLDDDQARRHRPERREDGDGNGGAARVAEQPRVERAHLPDLLGCPAHPVRGRRGDQRHRRDGADRQGRPGGPVAELPGGLQPEEQRAVLEAG